MGNIIILEIKYMVDGNENIIYPVVLLDDQNMVMVDCGFHGFLPLIEKAFEDKGLNISQLTHVVITHHDLDHMGSLNALKQKYPHMKVVANEIEAPYISGEKKSLRLEQAEKRQDRLPEEQKAFGLAFMDLIRKTEPCDVDMKVKGGDVFDWCGGCKIIGTPGHTPGHISLYLGKHKTVITGDAVVLVNERLAVANPQYALDLQAAKRSKKELLDYKADTVICYHGGVWEDKNISRR